MGSYWSTTEDYDWTPRANDTGVNTGPPGHNTLWPIGQGASGNTGPPGHNILWPNGGPSGSTGPPVHDEPDLEMGPPPAAPNVYRPRPTVQNIEAVYHRPPNIEDFWSDASATNIQDIDAAIYGLVKTFSTATLERLQMMIAAQLYERKDISEIQRMLVQRFPRRQFDRFNVNDVVTSYLG